MHSHKAKPDKINDKHGGSLLSINEYFGLLCYTFRQKALYTGIFSPLGLELLNRNCDEIYAERRKQLSNRNGLRA